MEDVFARLWNIVPWLALAGLLSVPLLHDKPLFLAMAWIPFGYLIATAFVEFDLGRYNVAVIPFVFCVAGGFVGAVVPLTRRWASGNLKMTEPAGPRIVP